jgi:hypothetical protein
MKPKPELIEAVILVYIQSEVKNLIIQHEKHAGTDFENCGEYKVFNKTLKEKDILKYCKTPDLHKEIAQNLHEFSWAEIRFIFLQYKLDDDSNIKLKLRPITDSGSPALSEWQVYGRSIPFFTFAASEDKNAFIKTFEKQLIKFLE